MTTPSGQRFTLTYLDRGEKPLHDSRRFRTRLQEWLANAWGDRETEDAFGRILVTETGCTVRRNSLGLYVAREVFESGELRDVLDAITIYYQFLLRKRNTERLIDPRAVSRGRFDTLDPASWSTFVERVLREENLGYRIDAQCGVHFFVDQEFDHQRTSTVATLQHPALVNARSSFDDAFRHMDASPADTKAAVRSIFEAAEVLTKQIFPEAQNLNRRLVETKLKARVSDLYPGDATAMKVWSGLFDGMADWVDALHNYRHGQAADEPVAPSEELAVFVLSTGCTYVRTLADCVVRAIV